MPQHKKPLDMLEIKRRYEGGMSAKQLARIYGCNHKTILDRLREIGVQTRDVRGAMDIMESATTKRERAAESLLNRNPNVHRLMKRWNPAILPRAKILLPNYVSDASDVGVDWYQVYKALQQAPGA